MRFERIGSYDVTALIGEGGMGQVYQATDTNLDRQVAIKVLPDAFSSDPDRLARFEREAKVLASLKHPNIGAIYGLEKSGDTRALVLELVEGPTLADRIAQGPIPIDEALPIAKQIAEALEAAHKAGVIHRDLKPANIKVKEDGTVKVLDFGLAKALDTTPEGDPSQSPTLTAAATQMGVIMGTAAYMSPEQAKGRTADRRSDIWAFGAVLFEMLAGRRAFVGDDVSDTLVSVFRDDPDWAALPDEVPSRVRQAIQVCLQKDPKQRVRDTSAIRLALEGAFETTVTPSDQAASSQLQVWQRPVPLVFAATALIAASGLAAWTLTNPTPPAPQLTTRSAILLPATDQLAQTNPLQLALSPDGRTLVYKAVRDGVTQLYRRELDQVEPVAIPGTENADNPFFSPDGEWLAFDSDGALKKVALRGGPATTICELPSGFRDATWTTDGTIILGAVGSGLLQVPGAGGEPRPFLDLEEGERGQTQPDVLPGGRAVLFRSRRDERRVVMVYSLDTGERRELVEGMSPHFLPTGHLVFGRAGSLWAVPFDLDELDLSGEPVPILEGVAMGLAGPPAQVAFASTGSLVYIGSDTRLGAERTFVWVDRDGREDGLALPPGGYLDPRLSPDESSLAVSVQDGNESDIRVVDMERLSPSRITFGGLNRFPVWSPNGVQLVFADAIGANRLLRAQSAGGGAIDPLLDRGEAQYPTSWASDGRAVAFYATNPDTGRDLWVLPMDGDQTPAPFLVTPFNERAGSFSPEGRWLAYVSDESGRDEVYVRPYPPDPSEEHTISTDGGRGPAWSRDGRELFYQNGKQMMVVAVESGESFRALPPQLLFVGDYAQPNPNGSTAQYDVSQDGRFLMMKTTDEGPPSDQLVLVQNWFEELKRLVPID